MLKLKQTGLGDLAAKTNLKRELMLLAWALKKGISFNSIDDDLFRLYHSVANWSTPPSRWRLSTPLLNTLYNIIAQKNKEKLKEADYFSVTSDAWTSEAFDKFVGLTIHFINKSWQLDSFVLAVIPLAESHTCYNVTEAVVQRIMENGKKESVLVSSVTDRGANFVKMSRLFMKNMLVAVAEGEHVDDWNERLPEGALEDDDDLTGKIKIRRWENDVYFFIWRVFTHVSRHRIHSLRGPPL